MEALAELGLSKREIDAYLALLETGSTTVGPLVKKSGIPNSKIYETLEKLINKGLASYVIVKGKKTFQASKPSSLNNILKEKERKLKEIIPKLELKQQLGEKKQSAEIYEGKKGVKEALSKIIETLNKGETYQVFGLKHEYQSDEFLQFVSQLHRKREEKGVRVQIIFEERSRKRIEEDLKVKLGKFRFTDIKLPTGIFIYKDIVLTLIWGEKPTIFKIQSEQNAERYKLFFEETWEKCRPSRT